MAWFRKGSKVPEKAIDPARVVYPFRFPLVAFAGEMPSAYLSAENFGIVGEAATRGEVPHLEVFTDGFERWTAIKVVAVSDLRRKLFGRKLYVGELEFGHQGSYLLSDLQSRIAQSVDDDQDDLWNQVADQDVVREAIVGATTFAQLVKALKDVGGQGM